MAEQKKIPITRISRFFGSQDFQLEQEMEMKLFRENEMDSYEIKFDTKGLLRGDSTARATYYREMTQIGAL